MSADKSLKRRRRIYANRDVSRFRNVDSCTTFWAMEGQRLDKEKAVGGAEGECCTFRANEEQAQNLTIAVRVGFSGWGLCPTHTAS
jgi:hypothetical protein